MAEVSCRSADADVTHADEDSQPQTKLAALLKYRCMLMHL